MIRPVDIINDVLEGKVPPGGDHMTIAERIELALTEEFGYIGTRDGCFCDGCEDYG